MNTVIGYLMIGLTRLMGLIPLRWSQRIGRLIGRLLWLRRTRSREVARLNLKLCYPDLSEEERDKLLYETLLQNGMTGTEMGPMWGYSQQEGLSLLRQVHGEDLLNLALADERGVLLLCPHQGNWEIANNYISSRCPITIMYRPAKSKVFNDWMVKRRELVGCKLVPTTGAGVKQLFKVLKEGEMVGFLPDQEPQRRSGVYAPFMAVEQALTPKLPHELLKRTGAIGLFISVERLPDAAGFDLHFIAVEEALYDDDPETAAAAMNRGIAQCVSVAPAQYQWTYKRFKRQQDGSLSPYKKARVP